MPDPFASLDVVGAPREVVAVGGTLDPATLRSAYRHGVFPWPGVAGDDRVLARLVRRGALPRLPGDDGLVPWCSTDPRAVLLPEQLRVSRSLRQRLRRSGWTASVDAAFDDVVAACADRAEGTWIDDRMRAAYSALHREGGAHSVEVWDGGELVGGLYGVRVGAVFCGESMFHRRTDASKVALVELCSRWLAGGGRLVDVQQDTEHLASLGSVLVRRAGYVEALTGLRDVEVLLATERLPVARLG